MMLRGPSPIWTCIWEHAAISLYLTDPAEGGDMATLVRELEAVEQLHDEFGFTYSGLAAAVNTSESNLHRWRSGNGAPPTPVFLARLEALRALPAA